MTNLILLIVLLVASWGAILGKPSRGRLLGGLGVIAAVLLFVSTKSVVESGDWGPAMGVGAFVGSLALFYFLRRK